MMYTSLIRLAHAPFWARLLAVGWGGGQKMPLFAPLHTWLWVCSRLAPSRSMQGRGCMKKKKKKNKKRESTSTLNEKKSQRCHCRSRTKPVPRGSNRPFAQSIGTQQPIFISQLSPQLLWGGTCICMFAKGDKNAGGATCRCIFGLRGAADWFLIKAADE